MLTKFQTDWPMIPYYFQDFLTLAKILLRMIVKHELVEQISSEKELQGLD